jgi:hypothetical protein
MRGFRVKATRSYISPFSQEKTHLCERHYRDAVHVMQAFDKGPYTRQTESGIGHKGGASEDMANLLSGSKAADARKVMLQTVLNEPMTAEEASRKAGFDPDYGSPRLSELIKKGLVATHDRKGRSDRGNPCGRYIATEAGKAVAA